MMTSELMDEIYVDQAYRHTSMSGYNFFAAYTPYGIKLLDTEFANRIRACERNESYTKYSWSYWSVFSDEPKREPRKEVEKVWTDTFESLEKDINENPHLHEIIKENLLLNLNNLCQRKNNQSKNNQSR